MSSSLHAGAPFAPNICTHPHLSKRQLPQCAVRHIAATPLAESWVEDPMAVTDYTLLRSGTIVPTSTTSTAFGSPRLVFSSVA